VVTVCFNAGVALQQTVHSVLGQTYRDLELLIIDGGSTDSSHDLVSPFLFDGRVRWFSEPDFGIYHAMNKGISLARGEWIIFMNAGDKFDTQDVLTVVLEEEPTPETWAIYSDVKYIRGDAAGFALKSCDHERYDLNHQCLIYRRSCHRDLGGYLVHPKLSIADYLFFRSIPKSKFIKTETIIAQYDILGVSSNYYRLNWQLIGAHVMLSDFGPIQALMKIALLPLKKILRRFFRQE